MKNTLRANTHKYRLFEWLKMGKSITTKQAGDVLGNQDLQGTIRDLKPYCNKLGLPIKWEDIKVGTRFYNKNGKTKYATVRAYYIDNNDIIHKLNKQ